MQPIEIVLFAVVAALALALIGTVVRPYLRDRQLDRARQAGGPIAPAPAAAPTSPASMSPASMSPASRQAMVCPACHRDYPPDLQFCPHDARSLIAANDPAARRPSAGTTCPTCKRSFDAGKRFCAFDGEELVPLALALGGAEEAAAFAGVLAKICPSCSRRYENEATFCGRDGEALVVVN
jgi:predicted amidophosphoribosyltransferase